MSQVVERVIKSSGRVVVTEEVGHDPSHFYYLGTRRGVSGPFELSDRRFVKLDLLEDATCETCGCAAKTYNYMGKKIITLHVHGNEICEGSGVLE